jgi:hypothetical protein
VKATASTQTTRLVGPAGLAQIRDALAISSPGDVIQVQPGTYAQFTVSIGVTIRALIPGTVNIQSVRRRSDRFRRGRVEHPRRPDLRRPAVVVPGRQRAVVAAASEPRGRRHRAVTRTRCWFE